MAAPALSVPARMLLFGFVVDRGVKFARMLHFVAVLAGTAVTDEKHRFRHAHALVFVSATVVTCVNAMLNRM